MKLMLVDDHALIRAALRRICEDAGGIEVVAETATGEEAVEAARRLKPDLVLLDLEMPGMGGVEATRRLCQLPEPPRVIALSVHGHDPYPRKVLEAGAHGYLTKSAGPEEVLSALRTVHSGHPYVSPEVAGELAMASINRNVSPLDSLSQRELQVMLMLTRGNSPQGISASLNVSPKTVCTYRYRLYEKLHVKNDVELTHFAIRHGLIAGGET